MFKLLNFLDSNVQVGRSILLEDILCRNNSKNIVLLILPPVKFVARESWLSMLNAQEKSGNFCLDAVCFLRVSSALFKSAVLNEVDNAEFITGDTALSRCMITHWSGGGVAAAALAVPANGQRPILAIALAWPMCKWDARVEG